MSLDTYLKLQPVLSGLGLGLLVVLVVLVLVARGERKLVRGPLVLLAIYGVARSAMEILPLHPMPVKLLHFIAIFCWCASVVRSVFIISGSSRLSRFVGRSWPKIVRDVVQAILYVVIALIALRAIGVEPTGLLTTSALLTAVLGLSMQDTLGNLFAGLALQGQQTVGVGDWVRFADGNEGLGEVTEINWRATHFLTNTRVQVIVPNSVLARTIVRNYSRPTRLVRHDTDITLPYEASPERLRSIVLAAIRGVDGVISEPEPTVLVMGFNDTGVVYSVRVFMNDYGRRDPIESAVRQRIYYAIHRARLELPFPQRTVSIKGTAPGLGTNASEVPPAEDAQLVERLGRFELLNVLSPAELGTLAAGARFVLYAPGEVIVRQGDAGGDIYALERGRVEVVATHEGRPPFRVSVIETGGVFGELALLTGERRTATVQALVECEVLQVSRAAFKHVFESNPALLERITVRLTERMQQLNHAVSVATEGEANSERPDVLMQRIRKFFAG